MRNIISILIASLLLLQSCSKFDEINTDPSRPIETNPQFLLSSAEKRASDIVFAAYYNGRIGMHYAQYWTGTDKTSESRNLITDDGLWAQMYSGPLMDLQEIENYYARHPEEKNPHMIAVANILKSWIFHVLTDLYVDIPYSQALHIDSYPQPAFDHAENVYSGLLANLQSQIDVLHEIQSGPVTGDILGNGSVDYWLRFANALRMRIALRMIDVKPAEASAIIVAAAQETLTGVEQDVFFPYNNASATNRYPYNEAERPMVEFAVTSTLVNYQKETNHPRLAIYARPTHINDTLYLGKTYGVAENNPVMDSLSKPGVAVYSPTMKGLIMTYAEVMFIKAEAAARGINVGGTAAQLYEQAIEASMHQWGIQDQELIDEYLLSVPYNAGNWRNTIGTQKWLALYMQGLQSWMERLRLDMKKPDGTDLFIAPASGSLDPEVADVPQRLNYPNATRNSNAANVEAAAQRIGGDSKATKNWWDRQ